MDNQERERERESCENHLTVCSSELLLSLTDVMMFTDVYCDVIASSQVLIWQPVGDIKRLGSLNELILDVFLKRRGTCVTPTPDLNLMEINRSFL